MFDQATTREREALNDLWTVKEADLAREVNDYQEDMY